MWETDVLILCVGIAFGFLLAQVIERKNRGFTPALFELTSIGITIFLGLLLINGVYWYNNIDTGYFLKASFIGILQAATTFGLGVVSVYLTRRHYQEKEKKENIDEIIAPLYFEVEKIREDLQLNDFTEYDFLRKYYPEWNNMKNTAMEIRAKNVDARIPEFYNRLNLHRNNYNDLHRYFFPQINGIFKKEVLPAQMQIKRIPHAFLFIYKTGYESQNSVWPYRYLILGLNPIDFMEKKDDLFETSNCKIQFWETSEGADVEHKWDYDYENIDGKFEAFFTAVENQLGGNPKIIALRRERKDLIYLFTEIYNDFGKIILA